MLGSSATASASVPGGSGNVAFDLAAGFPAAQASQSYGAANASGSVENERGYCRMRWWALMAASLDLNVAT